MLLKNINNDSNKIKKLNQQLLKIRVRPYYIFHPKDVIGTSHFYVKISERLEIVGGLRGQTSGLAIPTYVLNTPNGKGKVPLQSSYILGMEDNCVKIRTWEGYIIDYIE